VAGALSPGKSTLTQRIARSGADAPRDERSNDGSRDERTHDRQERTSSAWAEPDRWLADDRSPGDQQRVESDSVQTHDRSPALPATTAGATPVVDTGRSANNAVPIQRRAVPTAPTRLKDIVQLRRSGEKVQAAPTQEPGGTRAIGRRLDLSAPVQQREASPHDHAPSPDALHESAAAGAATPAQDLPHRPELEAAFGRDLSFVRAHVGGDAEASARDIGAEAYARGDDVVLSAGSSKHTVAHEVAHVLQQRGGEVQLAGGVGAVGDRYERQADDIADAVVRGESVAHVLPGGDVRGDQVQRAPASALAHDDFERTMDNRVYQATKAGQQLAAPAYLHANMRDVRRDVGSFLLARPIGPGNPQLAFTEGRQAFLSELATPLQTDDESASIELLQRWIAPTDLNALVDRNRPILDDGATMETMLESKGMLARDRSQLRYDKGAKGPPHWSPTVGTALGSELEPRLIESMARVAARLVALTDERRRAAAERDEAPADVRALEIPASHPLDRAVAKGFLPEGRPATVEVTAGALKVEPGALLAYRKVKQVAWQGATGGPWNAIRAIEPADANAEEMARHLWEDRAEAYRLRRVGALFFLAPDDAEAFPEAARHRPLSGAGSRIAAPVDDAYQQAIGPGAAEAAAAEASGLAPPAGIAPGSAALLAEWRLVHEQLTGLAVVTAPFGVAEPLLLADIQHSTRAVDLAILDPAQAAVRAAVFREQRSILGEVAAEVGNLTTQFEAQRAQAAQAPDGARQAVSEGQTAVLRAFVRAGAMAHLAQTGRAALAEARQVQQTAVLGALEQMLSDAITRVEITRQLSGETVVYTKHSAQIFGAGFAYRQAALRVRIADLRTQLRQGIVDGRAIQRLYGDVDALRFEASLVAHLGTIRQAVHAAEALEESDWVAAAGQIDDLEDVRGVGRDLMHDIRAIHREWLRIQQRAAALQQGIEAAGGAPDADAQAAAFAQNELATVKARLDKLGGDQRVADYLRRAYNEIDDAQTKAAILQICVLIGVTLVAAATGGAAQGAVAGIIGEGGGAILAGMFVESATMSVLNAALTGDSFVEAMTSDMAGNLVTLGALKGLDSLLATTKVGKVLLAGADDAGRAAYYTAKGVELTSRMLVIAGCQYAQMQYESLLRQGRTLSMDEVRQEGVKGVAMMIGTGVLTRLAKTPLTKLKALGARGGGLVKQHVELTKLATAVETSGDPARALELLRSERAHLEAEAETWKSLADADPADLRRMGLEPDMVATFAANAQNHLAGVDALASGALPAQLGLDPVVPGRVFAGDTLAVTSVLASYTDRGWTVATDGARHTVTSSDGATALTILERKPQSATGAPMVEHATATPAQGSRSDGSAHVQRPTAEHDGPDARRGVASQAVTGGGHEAIANTNGTAPHERVTAQVPVVRPLGVASVDGPRSVINDMPDLAHLGGLPPAIIGAHQISRVEAALQGLPAADYAEFRAVHGTLSDPIKQAFLFKALAAGSTVDEIKWLAGEMAAQDHNWMAQNLTLADLQGAGVGLKQQWSHSCNAATALVLRGNYDPVFALRMRYRNIAVSDVDGSDPGSLNLHQSDVERDMLVSGYRGAGARGYQGGGLAAPRDNALSGQGRPGDDFFSEQADATGLSFESRYDPAPDEALEMLNRALAQGMHVPVTVGSAPQDYAHYVLCMDRRLNGGRLEYQFHNTWDGVTYWVPASDIHGGSMMIHGPRPVMITGIDVPSVAAPASPGATSSHQSEAGQPLHAGTSGTNQTTPARPGGHGELTFDEPAKAVDGDAAADRTLTGRRLATGAAPGLPATEESIRVGTVRMEEHPRFHEMLEAARSAGFEVVIDPSVRDPGVEVILLVGSNRVRLGERRRMLLVPGMRYLDLEHEIGHVEQVTTRFRDVPYTAVHKVLENGNDVKVDPSNYPVVTGPQHAIIEYHNRLVEYLRLQSRGADAATLQDHASGVAYFRREAGLDGRQVRSSTRRWVQEHFPDLPNLEADYGRLTNTERAEEP
jgi:hypothetical protein